MLCGESLESLNAYMSTNGSQSTCYHTNLPIVGAWVAALESKVANVDLARPSSWIAMMLKLERHDRCSAQSLFDVIHESSRDPNSRRSFVGLCCTEEEDSDESVQSSIFDPEARERATETTTVSSNTSHVVPETPRGVVEAPPAMETLTQSAEEIFPRAVPTTHGEDVPNDGISQRIYIRSKTAKQQAMKASFDNTAYLAELGAPEALHDINAVKAELYLNQESHLPAFRWWYTNSGRHKAVLIGWHGSEVRLRGTNGEMMNIQLAELSFGDKEYLKTQMEGFTLPTEPAVPRSPPAENNHSLSRPTEQQDQTKQPVPLLDAESVEQYYRIPSVQEIVRRPSLSEDRIAVNFAHQPTNPSRWFQHSSAPKPADILTTLPITAKDYFVPHYITSTARNEYDDLFDLGTLGSSNEMTGPRFKQLLEGCGVSNSDLERIWGMVDKKDVGLLNLNGFAVAMHLIYRRLNSHPVPTVLEPDMQSVLDGEVWCNRAGNNEPPKYWMAGPLNETPEARPPLPPRNSTATLTTSLAAVDVTPTPTTAPIQSTNQSLQEASDVITETPRKDQTTPETVIQLKITHHGDVRRCNIKYADLEPAPLEEHIRCSLRTGLEKDIWLERYSNSRGTYIALPPSDVQDGNQSLWKEMKRAARTSRKIAFRVTFEPVQSKTLPFEAPFATFPGYDEHTEDLDFNWVIGLPLALVGLSNTIETASRTRGA